MTTPTPYSAEDEKLRERLKALKPHTNDQLPLGDLLSHKEIEAIMQLIQSHDEATAKAYGGCTKCYGKGYATYSGEYKARGMSWPDTATRYCDCSRGKQLEKRDEAREREIRIDEVTNLEKIMSIETECDVCVDNQRAARNRFVELSATQAKEEE